jgi:hypothetical protein
MTDWIPIEAAPETWRGGKTLLGWSRYLLEPVTVAFRNGKLIAVWEGDQVIECQSDFGTEYKDPNPITHLALLPEGPTVSEEI